MMIRPAVCNKIFTPSSPLKLILSLNDENN